MGRIISITGPSYAGKTTLINHLKENSDISVPRHITTREKRIDDEPGFYRYISLDDYNNFLKHDELLLSSGMNDRMYGILKDDLYESLNKANNTILSISYKDIYNYLLLEYEKLLITLTFKNIEDSIKNRYYLDKNKRLSEKELLIRIKAALDDHNKYFEIIKIIVIA